MTTIIGTAGWSLPRSVAERFPPEGSSLERYAARFRGAEINSSFHRPHRASTWARWAESVPTDFRFAAKLPKTISHQQKLVGCEHLVARFLEESAGLGDKLAILLLQLPPKLAFDAAPAEDFLAMLGSYTMARIVCEPRHPSWFEDEAGSLLVRLGVPRAAADPAIVPAAAVPGGWPGLAYWRLHGSPVMYRSAYGTERITDYAARIRNVAAAERWCMFDNTASSAATGDALDLAARLY
ncbi:DUF72 domain-containing protein [Sphingosinicella sp. BN140058]|uniref:DUF72 domain-containing protein n=1 Tax=Sphingosinicella sp. BN140058 TaxID=1892855 RepID=UPI0010108C8C|nr:DUF72 domain-containing protein [Sphingosinicella sp. BN140058]QAY78286.1 DUF72 domain-containing protein [Sphingosinicella sp. BN140058]